MASRSLGVLAAGLLLAGCRSGPLASIPFHDTFDRSELGSDWQGKGGWRIVDGALFNDGAHNLPLWLRAPLPDDVRVTFTAVSASAAVDLKFEIFGDGVEHQSGYVVILSGWNNTKSLIARRWEHAPERTGERTAALVAEVAADPAGARARHRDAREVVARLHRGEMGHRYAFRFERRGGWLRWWVDDALHLEYFDPAPLSGAGQDRFAFNNWASRVTFDDLVIEALGSTATR